MNINTHDNDGRDSNAPIDNNNNDDDDNNNNNSTLTTHTMTVPIEIQPKNNTLHQTTVYPNFQTPLEPSSRNPYEPTYHQYFQTNQWNNGDGGDNNGVNEGWLPTQRKEIKHLLKIAEECQEQCNATRIRKRKHFILFGGVSVFTGIWLFMMLIFMFFLSFNSGRDSDQDYDDSESNYSESDLKKDDVVDDLLVYVMTWMCGVMTPTIKALLFFILLCQIGLQVILMRILGSITGILKACNDAQGDFCFFITQFNKVLDMDISSLENPNQLNHQGVRILSKLQEEYIEVYDTPHNRHKFLPTYGYAEKLNRVHDVYNYRAHYPKSIINNNNNSNDTTTLYPETLGDACESEFDIINLPSPSSTAIQVASDDLDELVHLIASKPQQNYIPACKHAHYFETLNRLIQDVYLFNLTSTLSKRVVANKNNNYKTFSNNYDLFYQPSHTTMHEYAYVPPKDV